MKTNYLQRSRFRQSKSKRALLVLAIFVAAVLILGLLRGPLVTVASPIWKSKNFFSQAIANTFEYFHTKSSLIKENNDLKDRLASYESLVISARSIEKKNIELMDLVNRSGGNAGVLAGVISRPPQTPYDILLVDAGSSENVVAGMRALTADGYALGRISETYSSRSRVHLFSLSGEKTDAVLERGMVPLILVGAGGGNFKVALPRDMTVVAGDRILLAGSGELVAVVGDISLKPTDSFKEVLAYTPINPSNLTSIFIK